MERKPRINEDREEHGNARLRTLARPLLQIGIILLALVLPFLLFGNWFEELGQAWLDAPPAPRITAILAIGLLSSDLLLPVPSSAISTLAGSQLGTTVGTLVCWLGMNLGAVAGYAMARYWGRPLADRFAHRGDLEQMEQLNSQFGPAILILFRAVPVLAEASVLLVGLHALSWPRFLIPVLLSNLGIAYAYAQFGSYAVQNGWLPFALAVSIAAPAILIVLVHAWLAASKR
jgi:uncharacterized membrane protein YdjX (TVP38/TMEM64 family)